MNFKLIVQKEATLDVYKAFIWYEAQRLGLGNEFLLEMEDCYSRLLNNPYHYSIINSGFRKVQSNRFPYLIIFEIENNNIIVSSVRHTSRKPKH